MVLCFIVCTWWRGLGESGGGGLGESGGGGLGESGGGGLGESEETRASCLASYSLLNALKG